MGRVSRARVGHRRRPRPQQLDALKEREEAAAVAARRWCPEPDCVIELRPWQKAHPGLHCGFTSLDGWNRVKATYAVGPYMWGRVGDRFVLGDLREVKDSALGFVIFAHSRPDDIAAYERTIGALRQGRSIVGV